jgi:hypothetical protein
MGSIPKLIPRAGYWLAELAYRHEMTTTYWTLWLRFPALHCDPSMFSRGARNLECTRRAQL